MSLGDDCNNGNEARTTGDSRSAAGESNDSYRVHSRFPMSVSSLSQGRSEDHASQKRANLVTIVLDLDEEVKGSAA